MKRPSIEVVGSGIVAVEPDLVELTLGLMFRAPTAAAALEQLAAGGTQLAHLLDVRGIPPSDRRTEQLQLSTRYDDYSQSVIGHVASQATAVRLGAVDQVGPLLDQASRLDLGDALQANGLVWVSTGEAEARREARRLAVEDALQRCRELAAAAGLSLGPVRAIGEERPLDMGGRRRLGPMSLAAAGPVSVEPGRLEFGVSVRIVCDILGPADPEPPRAPF